MAAVRKRQSKRCLEVAQWRQNDSFIADACYFQFQYSKYPWRLYRWIMLTRLLYNGGVFPMKNTWEMTLNVAKTSRIDALASLTFYVYWLKRIMSWWLSWRHSSLKVLQSTIWLIHQYQHTRLSCWWLEIARVWISKPPARSLAARPDTPVFVVSVVCVTMEGVCSFHNSGVTAGLRFSMIWEAHGDLKVVVAYWMFQKVSPKAILI